LCPILLILQDNILALGLVLLSSGLFLLEM
jgi:hypothetical protein